MGDSIIVVGLGFGDEGKGTIVDYLARQYPEPTVVRFNGGAQAAHNVVTPDGLHHTFAQFGSGTLAGARTHLSAHMIVNPMNMLQEAQVLATQCRQWDAFDRLTIDPGALVTTRFHMAWNRISEMMRGPARHGSCGQGIGATVEYAIKVSGRGAALRVGDLRDQNLTANWLTIQRAWYLGALPDHVDYAAEKNETLAYELDILRNIDIGQAAEDYYFWTKLVQFKKDSVLDGDLIFEGAQGALLDEQYGAQPHTTWSRCHPENARHILSELRRRPTRTIGVTRTYMTRHGAGPLPTGTVKVDHPEPHNAPGTYQGTWRQGHLDIGLLKYALTFSLVNEIAVTHMDCLDDLNRVAVGYRRPFGNIDSIGSNEPEYAIWDRASWIPLLQDALGQPVHITSHGPTANDKEDTRCASTV